MPVKVSLSVAVLVFGLGACGGGGGGSKVAATSPGAVSPTTEAPPAPTAVTITQKEFGLSLTAGTVAHGAVAVTVQNRGALTHEIVFFRTELPEASLVAVADGSQVDEDGAGITHIDPEAEDVLPAKDKSISVNLSAGRYVVMCNIPGHYKSGMHAVLIAS
jgi:uncharacterized cupredoxin-like copper-binding protein